MNEFKTTGWQGEIITFNYSGDNDPSKTIFASACLTNGCTNHKQGQSRGIAHYDLELRRDYVRLASGGSYWCPFTLDQVIRNLEDINEVVPFTFKIEETPEMFMIHLEIENSLSNRTHFYVLTRVRYLYEFPQCALFNDVFRLKDTVEEFADWSLQDLYNLVVSAIPVVQNTGKENFVGRSYWYDSYHSIPLNSVTGINERVSNKEMKGRNYKFTTLNQTYRMLNKIPAKIKYHKDLFNSLAYWRDVEGFELRLPFYKENSTLYTEQEKTKAGKVEIEYYEEKVKGILDTKIDLGLTREKAVNLISKDRNRRQKKISEDLKAWREEQRKKAAEPKPKGVKVYWWERPRDSKGRFMKVERI